MKKVWMIVLALALLIVSTAVLAENTDDWRTAPVFVKAYEQSTGNVYVEWEGHAELYQVYMDGNKIAEVFVNHHVIKMEKGTHQVVIYPVYELKDIDTKVNVEASAASVGGAISIDLAALGLDADNLYAGTPSAPLVIDYKPSQIVKGTPEDLSAYTIQDDKVVLSFVDRYNADEYLLTVKHKNDENYLTYPVADKAAGTLITRSNANVSIILDPSFLQSQECMVPEVDKEYKFTVQLRKYATDYVTGEKEKSVVLESKVSGTYTYKVTAAWKAAPEITFSSQIADGQVELHWDHEKYGVDCEYAVMKINKVLGVMTGEEQLGKTGENQFVIKDLTNGDYCINIVPMYAGEKGSYSADANVTVKNEWVTAPELTCEQTGDRQVTLSWNVPANVDQYHITVYTGDNGSLLRFVDLDFSKHAEFDLDAVEGSMEYTYTYDGEPDPDNGIRMKFEIYGTRWTESGAEQKSSVSTKTLVVK